MKAKLGERAHVAPADLGDAASVEALVPEAEKLMGGLDILVNNAGLTRDGLSMRMKDEDWAVVLKVNLEAAFRLSRAAHEGHDAPALRPHRRHHLRRRGDRQCRTGQLRRLQGRA